MQNPSQTKDALRLLLLGGLFVTLGGLAGILAQPEVRNYGAWMAFIGGVPLTVFALCGLLSKSLFARLAQR